MIDERSSMDQRAPVTRRRLLTIAAAAAGCATIGLRPARAGAVASYTWHGVALGANASLTLQHTDESIAKAAIASCLEEVARLEAVFSLHRSDSALSQLNAQGTLTAAPHDLRRCSRMPCVWHLKPMAGSILQFSRFGSATRSISRAIRRTQRGQPSCNLTPHAPWWIGAAWR